MSTRVRTVEYDRGWGWIARCPRTGIEIMEKGFRWRTRYVARTVVEEHKLFGCKRTLCTDGETGRTKGRS